MALSPRALRLFVAVAETGGIAAAARRLGLSIAAVSEAVSGLEAQLGRPLFERDRRRLKLNAAGTSLLPRAQGLLRELDDLEAAYRAGRAMLRIGASVTVGNYLLPDLIVELSRSQPDLDLDVIIRNTQAIADAVEAFQVAVAIVEGGVVREDLRARPWRFDDLIVIAPPDHPLSAEDATPHALAAATWVLREPGAGTRETFKAAAAAHFPIGRVGLTVGGNELLKAAVRAGVGLGCISRAAAKWELARGDLCEVRAPWLSMRRTLTVLTHVRKAPDPDVSALLALCHRTAEPEFAGHFV